MENGKIKVWLPSIRTHSGTDVFTLRLAKALEEQGMCVEIRWFPLLYEMLPGLLNFFRAPAGTDIVIANSWNGFAFKRTGVPLIVTLHHSAFDHTDHAYRSWAQRLYHTILIRPFEMRSFRAADKLTAVSNYAAQSLRQHLQNKRDIEVIHNWVDTEHFKPNTSLQKNNDKRFRLLFVGKLSRLKGADLLAPIMRQLGNDFELGIAGKVKQEQAKRFPENIKVLGYLNEEELIRAYQECDALLFPSRSEGFGYTVLEAMACGKPVVASKATALPEVVADEITGILCAVDDINAFVKACYRLREDSALYKKMGDAARRHAVTLFSETAAITRYVQLINRLVKADPLTKLP